MAIPRITKVKVSVGVGKIARKGGSSNSMDDARMKQIAENIERITGQKSTQHLSKKAISNFKLRAGMPIGISVTLRGKRAYDFISRLVNIALPRVRDFRGISPKSFDGKGNYSLGMKDFTVFPEVRPEDADFVHGVEITVVTSAQDDKSGLALLTALGFPFKKDDAKKRAAEEAAKAAEEAAKAEAEAAAAEAGFEKPVDEKPAEEGEGEEVAEGEAKPEGDEKSKEEKSEDKPESK